MDALELLLSGYLGIAVGIVLTAWCFHSLGLTDPSWLAITAVCLGAPAGYVVERLLFMSFLRATGADMRRSPRARRAVGRSVLFPVLTSILGTAAALYSFMGVAMVASLSGANPSPSTQRWANVWMASFALSVFLVLSSCVLALLRRRWRDAALNGRGDR